MKAKTITEHESVNFPDSEPSVYDEKLKEGFCLNPTAEPFNRRYFLQWNPLSPISGYTASYIIGAQWVETLSCGNFPLAVLPKIPNIDYLEMFMQCFTNPDEYESFHKIYGIDFDAEPIECETLESILSPLLIVQYVHVVRKLLQKDLRKSYVSKSENLNKIRGRMAMSVNLRTNIMNGRQHKVFCNYQEYTSNTIENRIIKKALNVSKSMIGRLHSSSTSQLNTIVNICLSKMSDVSDSVSLSELKLVKFNAIYKSYKKAVNLAKYIIKRYDYSIDGEKCGITAKVPPFWVDMPLLFEHYIGGILAKSYPDDIIYQAKGKTGFPDFLSKTAQAILDTKYKPQLDKNTPETDIIRQLAGYSRDCDILDLLGADYKTIIPCAFIYPDENAPENGDIVFSRPLNELLSPESGYAVNKITDFYCIGVGIPKIRKAY